VGEIAAKTVVQLLFATGKSFTVDGLREKLREFFREEVRAELRAAPALNNLELITTPAARSCGPSTPRHQRSGFAYYYGGPQQGFGRVFKRTNSSKCKFSSHNRNT
jgi:hypothetical protein